MKGKMKNKKLRLVVTAKCHNNCPLCCNNRFDLNELPVVDRGDYDEIMITGGEPMLFPDKVVHIASLMKQLATIIGKTPKVYLHTAVPNGFDLNYALHYFDGAVVTPHTAKDVKEFVRLNKYLLLSRELFAKKSLRLNLFPEVKSLLPNDIDLSLWTIKNMEWVKDCPVPEGEDLRRINPLFE